MPNIYRVISVQVGREHIYYNYRIEDISNNNVDLENEEHLVLAEDYEVAAVKYNL